MSWIEIVSLISNFVVGGGVITLFTLKSTRRKSAAEADSVVVDNTEKITKLWEDYAAQKTLADQEQIKTLTGKVDDFDKLVNSLKMEIRKLTKAINEAKKCPTENCPALKSLNDAT